MTDSLIFGPLGQIGSLPLEFRIPQTTVDQAMVRLKENPKKELLPRQHGALQSKLTEHWALSKCLLSTCHLN